MMECPQCHNTNEESNSFCRHCGTALTSATQPSTTSSSTPAPSLHITLPAIAFTTQLRDFWRLGAILLLIISLFLPFVSLPGNLSIAPIHLGFSVWILLLILIGAGVLTAVPAWRFTWWPDAETFLSAAWVGGVITAMGIVLGISVVTTHLIHQLSTSGGGLLGLVPGGINLSINLGVGLVFSLIASIVWAVVVRLDR